MEERFAKPCVGAIIEKTVGGERFILMQTRDKVNDAGTNGMVEIPAGKIREYENIFDALRREVREETGLTVTKIHGEESAVSRDVAGHTIVSFTPYCVTQNLSGIYSIIVNTFLCEAEGETLESSDESRDIHWISVKDVRDLITNSPERVFIMHLNALAKYVNENCPRDGIPADEGPDTLCTMVVEQTKQHQKRMRYNPETRSFYETNGDSLGYKRGFNYPYGWIKESGTPPEPHWDVMLMSDKDFQLGDEVGIRIIGVFVRGDGDHKFVAVERCRSVYDLSALGADEMDSLRRLYPRVGMGEGWFGRDRAGRVLTECEKPL